MNKIYKAWKVRVYPTEEQTKILNKNLGANRALYNMMLHERIEVYEKLKDDKRALYEYKYMTPTEYKFQYPWLSEQIDSQGLNAEVLNVKSAYSNFFKSLSGKRKGQKSGFPKFKKKKAECSYSTCATSKYSIQINYEDNKVRLPIVGWVKFRDGNRKFDGIIKKATIRRTSTGKYFVSVLFEQEKDLETTILPAKAKVVGLDMSLENFFIDSDGTSPAYERLYRENEKKLKKLQRRFSKKKDGSKNKEKARLRLSLLHEKITNKRHDFTHKLSAQLVKENDVIVVENLSLKGMSQALKLGKSVMDLGYSEFVRQLQYKSLWNNKFLIEADKWFPSSKTCHKCGYIYKELTLSEREWCCPNCGVNHNRDINAAINLKQIGLGKSKFKPVEKKASVLNENLKQDSSVKQEKYILDVV